MSGKGKEKSIVDVSTSVVGGLRSLYKTKIRPVEEKYHFADFHSPCMEDSDFVAKPFVLVLGQYSTGKTSFIEHLLHRPYPGSRIGPEPTTDRFTAVMYGVDDQTTPGNALATRADMPFRGLQQFGTSFLNKLEGVQCPSAFLESCTLIDTPGVLSGEKQRIGRTYDFPKVVGWWAERSDLILLLFDAHKLDISDEFRAVIQALRGQDDKVRVVLNKADSVNDQQLMRVYGALMWALGKCVSTPEVMRVYIGSFWDLPYREGTNHTLFNAEKEDLYKDLATLPKNASIRKINDLIKRARSAKVHALLIAHLKSQMPAMFWREAKQKELLDTMEEQFWLVQRKYNISPGDFPDINGFKETYQHYDFGKFPKLDTKMIQGLDTVLSMDIPALMARFSAESSALPMFTDNRYSLGQGCVMNKTGHATVEALEWDIAEEDFKRNQKLFATLTPRNGLADKARAQQLLMKSELPFDVLGQIWSVADYDQDGHLDVEEFTVAMYLAYRCRDGDKVPDELPQSLVPPSKRRGSGRRPSVTTGDVPDATAPAAQPGKSVLRSQASSPNFLFSQDLSEDPLSGTQF